MHACPVCCTKSSVSNQPVANCTIWPCVRMLSNMKKRYELLPQGNSLGLPLGLEAPVMTPNGVIFIFIFFSLLKQRFLRPITVWP